MRSLPRILLASLMASGLGACTVHTVDRRPVVYETTPAPPPPQPTVVYETRVTYRYWGAHLVPDEWGGGWCFIDGVHDHDYAPVNPNNYRYEAGVYYWSAPVIVTYWDVHPDPYGGWCYLHGSHTHNYHPPRNHSAQFHYDRQHRYYSYEHDAVPAGRDHGRPGYDGHDSRPADPRPGYGSDHGPSYPRPGSGSTGPSYPTPGTAGPSAPTPGGSTGSGPQRPPIGSIDGSGPGRPEPGRPDPAGPSRPDFERPSNPPSNDHFNRPGNGGGTVQPPGPTTPGSSGGTTQPPGRPSRPDFDRPSGPTTPGSSGGTTQPPGRPSRPDFNRPSTGGTTVQPPGRPSRPDLNRPTGGLTGPTGSNGNGSNNGSGPTTPPTRPGRPDLGRNTGTTGPSTPDLRRPPAGRSIQPPSVRDDSKQKPPPPWQRPPERNPSNDDNNNGNSRPSGPVRPPAGKIRPGR